MQSFLLFNRHGGIDRFREELLAEGIDASELTAGKSLLVIGPKGMGIGGTAPNINTTAVIFGHELTHGVTALGGYREVEEFTRARLQDASASLMDRIRKLSEAPMQDVGDVKGYLGSLSFEDPQIVELMELAKANIGRTALEEVTAQTGGIAFGKRVGLKLRAQDIPSGYHSPSQFSEYVSRMHREVTGPVTTALTSGMIRPDIGKDLVRRTYYDKDEIEFFQQHIQQELKAHGAAVYSAGMLRSAQQAGDDKAYEEIESYIFQLETEKGHVGLMDRVKKILQEQDETVPSDIGRRVAFAPTAEQAVEATVSVARPAAAVAPRQAAAAVRIPANSKKNNDCSK